MPQLIRREGNDFHIQSQQYHGIHWNGDRPASKAEEASEIDHDQNLALTVADEFADVPEHVLAFDGTQNVPAQKLADPHGLREAHGRGLRQAHPRRRRHAARRGALRVRGAGQNDQRTANAAYLQQPHATHIPANHEKPRDSQYPPGYVFVTSMAVTHLGFL